VKHILKINYPLSNKPLYVSVSDPNMTMDEIFAAAIEQLAEAGRLQESEQLAKMYATHQLFDTTNQTDSLVDDESDV